MTEKHIYIDVWNPMENRVDVVQGEVSARYVVAHIHNSGVPLNLEGASVQFYGTKPDGTGILNDCEVLDGKRGIVSIPMTQQMSIAPGEYEEAGLQIIRDGKVLKVLGLSIVVHPAYDYDEYLSEDELTAVQEAIDRSNYAASRIPSIGENGNWYLGEEDTGKPSRGKEGIRGRGLLKVSTAPTEESSTVDGYAYKYKFKLSTVLSESGASEVLVGDALKYSYYEYGVGYVGASYAFAYTRTSIRGANGTSVTVSSVSESTADGGDNVVTFSDGKTLTVKNGKQGAAGKTAYQYAQDGGYTGTESEFIKKLASDSVIVAQDTAPEDTSVLWIDTSDESNKEKTFANPLYGKKIAFNGDSISAMPMNYAGIIAERNAMTYQNIAVGGATIAYYTSSTTGTTYHCISRTVDDMDETSDYAIVQGGINDSVKPVTMGSITDGYEANLDDTTFYGAFESMLKRLIIRFPGKKIGYIAMHKCQHGNFDSRNTNGYYQAAKKCCEKWGVPFCDLNTTVPPLGLIEELKVAYTSDGDGVHPTAEGYRKFYCDKVEAWLKTL